MNYLKRIEDNLFKKKKIMVMLVAAVLIVDYLFPHFITAKMLQIAMK
jgi:hypothetical protein